MEPIKVRSGNVCRAAGLAARHEAFANIQPRQYIVVNCLLSITKEARVT